MLPSAAKTAGTSKIARVLRGRMSREGRLLRASSVAIIAGLALSACGGSSRAPTSATSRATSGAAIPAALVRERRPIGRGPRFAPPARGPVIGACRRSLGRARGVHVEVFAANRVVLIPAGIGTRAPRKRSEGRISHARCYGALVTLDPTGVVLVRTGTALTLADLFRAWGQPLSTKRLATFAAPAGDRVSVFVGGRRWRGAPGSVPLHEHAEIVLEVGPHVPPHVSYAFPPGT